MFPIRFTILFLLLSFKAMAFGYDLNLYELLDFETNDGERYGFVSLTDSYEFEDTPEETVIAEEYLGEGISPYPNYHFLSKLHRDRFLKHNSFTSSDTIYIYDFNRDSVWVFPLDSIPLIGIVSPYVDVPNDPYDYMLGLKIPASEDWPSYARYLVAIEEGNPFNTGRLKQLTLTQAEKVDVALIDRRSRVNLRLYKLKPDFLLTSVHDKFNYSLLVFKHQEGYNAALMHIVDEENASIALNALFMDSESGYLYFPNEDQDVDIWSGKLLKNFPAVLTDLKSYTFGCEALLLLDGADSYLPILCDNRH